MRPISLSIFVLFALFGMMPAVAQQASTGGDLAVCNGERFDKVFFLSWPDSDEGSTGCIGWNMSASKCTFYDNWRGGRTGTVSCRLKGSKLKLDSFDYAGADNHSRVPMKITLKDVDPDRVCFGDLDYTWGTSRGYGDPDGASVCPCPRAPGAPGPPRLKPVTLVPARSH